MMNPVKVPTAGNMADLAILLEIIRSLSSKEFKADILEQISSQLAEAQEARQKAHESEISAKALLAEVDSKMEAADKAAQKAKIVADSLTEQKRAMAAEQEHHAGVVRAFNEAQSRIVADLEARDAKLTAREGDIEAAEAQLAHTLANAEELEAEYKDKLAKLKAISG